MAAALYRVEFQLRPTVAARGRIDGLVRKVRARRGTWWLDGLGGGDYDVRPLEVRFEVSPEHEEWLRVEVNALVAAGLVLEQPPLVESWDAPLRPRATA